MSSVFLDSSFLIALHSSRDQYNLLAVATWRAQQPKPHFITTTFVLDEVVSYLNRHDGHDRAVEVGVQMLRSPSISLLPVDERLLGKAWDYFVRHADKKYSLTDCISFVVMEERGVPQALTFDRRFEQAGFRCVPPLAKP
jgi:predicted nucleic acid-binding protein